METACGPGGCSGGQCQVDKCAGATCTTPPAATCADATKVLTHSSPGTCDPANGKCTYTTVTVACKATEQCTNGACVPLPCGPATCDGCCTQGVCKPFAAQSNAVCGNQGAACGACSSGMTCGSGLCVSPMKWTLKSPAFPRPAARWGGAMAYDAARKRVVLYGGSGGAGTSVGSETWEWDGTKWTQRTPTTNPGYRFLHSMAYDSARQRIVLFGGASHGAAASTLTWEWDGTSWIQKSTSVTPAARQDLGLVYDAARARVLLFGGEGEGPSATFSGPPLNETWEWDGTTWKMLSPTNRPLARTGPALAYDSSRQVVVLFGGRQGDTFIGDDTWEWNGTNWASKSSTPRPPGRFKAGLAYDSARGKVVMYGGGYTGDHKDTWEWDGQLWVKHSSLNEPPARIPMVAYDSSRQRLVLFGGIGQQTTFGDLWEREPGP